MNGDLNATEQRHVRTALRFMRIRVKGWAPLGEALHLRPDTLERIASGRRAATPGLAIRMARIADVTFDDLVAGRWLSPRVCKHCGHPPDDFADEDTVIEAACESDEPMAVLRRMLK